MLIKRVIATILALSAVPAFSQDIAPKYEVVPLGMNFAFGLNNKGYVVGSVPGRAGSPPKAATWFGGELSQVPLQKGYRESNLTFVGENNVVLGNSITTNRKKQVAFKIEGDKLTWLPNLGGTLSSPLSVNDSGNIVGVATNSAKNQRAFYFNGSIKDLGTLGGNSATASRINDSGLIVGWSSISPSGNVHHAFKYENNKMVDLSPESSKSSWAYGLNNSSDIVGAMDTETKRRAVLWSNGSRAFLTSDFGVARSVNNNKMVVGTMEVPFEQTIEGEVFRTTTLAPFVWAKGSTVDLNKRIDAKLGWVLLQGISINDKGEILVLGVKDGKQQALLLKPM